MAGRGSQPGERRGGRRKGTPNKVTAEIREAAQTYTTEALEVLAEVMRKSKNDSARVMAANHLLDRGWGKASQHVDARVSTDFKN